MKYEVGDKVRIKPYLVIGDYYGAHSVNDDMIKFCDKVCTISKVDTTSGVDNGHYVLKEDPAEWRWTDEMISGKYIDKPKITLDERLKNNFRKTLNKLRKNSIYGVSANLSIIDDNLYKEDVKMSNNLIEKYQEEKLEELWKEKAKKIEQIKEKTEVGKTLKALEGAIKKANPDYNIDWIMCQLDKEAYGKEILKSLEEIEKIFNQKKKKINDYCEEAHFLFDQADTYKEKLAILKEYGILKNTKSTTKTEVK